MVHDERFSHRDSDFAVAGRGVELSRCLVVAEDIEAEFTNALDAVGRIHVEAWRAAYVDALPAAFLERLSIADRQRRWRQRLTAPDRKVCVLVVVNGEEIAGFACVGASRDENVPASVGELQSIDLDPEKWGRGLGRRLHEDAVATLRRAGYARATLWVLEGNARARRFYECAGWALDGAEKVDSIAGSPTVTEIRYTRAL